MSTHLQVLPSVTNRGPHARSRYFLEIRNRNRWLLENGGERVLLLKRKHEGTVCANRDDVRRRDAQHGFDPVCFGTGFVGGYFKPIEIMVSLVSGGPEQVVWEEWGKRRISVRRSWTLWEPILQNGDILVRKFNGQRLRITNVFPHRWRSYIMHQDFETDELERDHSIYKFPI
jgi:hypothetical protein